VIQYPRDSVIKPKGLGVLDRPVKPGDDGGLVGGRTATFAFGCAAAKAWLLAWV